MPDSECRKLKMTCRTPDEIELEKPLEDEIGMEVEALVLKRGQGLGHFLRYIDEGTHGTFSFFVMQLAGPSLSDLQKKCHRKRFSNDTTTRLAVQCLEATENIHIVGFLHRDIKPSNFLAGAPGSVDAHTVYILDFGLVRRYRTKDGQVRNKRESTGFRGSYQYCSIKAHKCEDLGRRDDLWSLLYSLIQMRVGKLPWRKLLHSDEIREFKEKTSREDLLIHMEPEYVPFYDHVANLRYSQRPDYEFLRAQIERIWCRKNYNHQTPFDWERGERFIISSMLTRLIKIFCRLHRTVHETSI
uniref:Protein kinase domain-containing protein n=1 Tax=Romanomermis culicivorax TaxID=13658 RepID=A0A915L4F7_ROMCU